MADWDFIGANTKRMTHGIHPYPAMMIPQIAARLIDSYGRGARVLFDPFCGAGASLLEANLRGINAVGADLNPLARLIARVKTAPIEAGKLKRRLRRVNDAIFHARFDANPKIPPIANIDFWFSPAVQRNLAVLRAIIDAEADAATRRFLAVAFSETVRECSYTRNGEFKLYRIPAARRESFAPDVFGLFVAKLARNFAAMERFAAAKIRARSRIFDLDSAQTAPSIKADLIVTSPPYGDSKTTVAYGQFSRLANEWLGIENAAAIDRKMLGGSPQKNTAAGLGCAVLEDAVSQIAARDSRRAREVCVFYADYRQAVANAAKTVAAGGRACFVVGNRRVKGIELPTDRATRAYFADNGFRFEAAFTRRIPNKRMPSRNSPTNAVGATEQTITREHIVVMRKS